MDVIALFDTHCHLDFEQFDEDRDAVLARMKQAGVNQAVVAAVDLEHLPRLFRFAETQENIFCGVGIHPNHELQEEPSVEQLCALADHQKCVAIGETGMDFFHHHVAVDIQEQRFRTHIRAAIHIHKPVIIHMREADAPTLRIMREESIHLCGGIMHCFSSTWDAASQAIDMGMSISFSGNLTFKRNIDLREVAAKLPNNALLIETDSPYLAPVPHRGKRNEPAFVKHVAECLSELKQMPLPQLASLTTFNAQQRFSLNYS